jgi:hypothetical protein
MQAASASFSGQIQGSIRNRTDLPGIPGETGNASSGDFFGDGLVRPAFFEKMAREAEIYPQRSYIGSWASPLALQLCLKMLLSWSRVEAMPAIGGRPISGAAWLTPVSILIPAAWDSLRGFPVNHPMRF